MKIITFPIQILLLLFLLTDCDSGKNLKSDNTALNNSFIRVSSEDPRYFEYSDGSPYIPVGMNMISPGGRYRNNPDSSLYDFGQWMKNISVNGGNFIRVWLSNNFWDIEDQRAGEYREEKARRIDRMLEMAETYDLKVKMTLEHFRSLTQKENPQSWAVKSVYHTSGGGPLDSIRQYLTSASGRKLFTDKLDFYQKRYGSNPVIFGWELWNEMNAMKGPEESIFFTWNELMLGETKTSIPRKPCDAESWKF